MTDVLSLGTLFYIFALALFCLRLTHNQEVNYYWIFALFISGAFIWMGFFFTVFPFQTTVSSTTIVNSSITIAIANSTEQFPIANVNSTEFIGLATITAMWTLLMFLLGISEWITILHNEVNH